MKLLFVAAALSGTQAFTPTCVPLNKNLVRPTHTLGAVSPRPERRMLVTLHTARKQDGDEVTSRSGSSRSRPRKSLGKRRSPFKLYNPNPGVFEDQDVYDRKKKYGRGGFSWSFGGQTTKATENKALDEAKEPKNIPDKLVDLSRAATAYSLAKFDGKNLDPPRNSVARISKTDAGTLSIDIPSKGTSTESIIKGVTSVAFLSAIASATAGAGLLMMLPMYAAGGLIAKSAIVDPYLASRLEIGEFAFAWQTVLGKTKVLSSQDGPTSELRGAVVAIDSETKDGNGVVTFVSYKLDLYRINQGKPLSMGQGLELEELEYLSRVVNGHLDDVLGKQGGDERRKQLAKFDESDRNEGGFYIQ